MTPYTLKKDKSQLLIIDVQERLLPAIYDNTSIVRNIKLLLKAAQVLSIPTKYTEQYPKGLGPTVSDVLELLPTETPRFEKIHFSCSDEGNFKDFLGQERKQVILAGIETHICILGTVMDLLNDGYQVVIAIEGVGSRRKEHHLAALNVLSQCGAMLLPTESIIYQWLSKSGTFEFKEMLPLFKE